MRRLLGKWVGRLVAVLLLFAVGFAAALWWLRPALTDEEVREIVLTTIQRETPASFYVTGYVDMTAAVTVENTKYLLPDVLRLNLGTTRSTVRAPGRVSYGFDIDRLRPESIRLLEDGVIEVTLPELSLYSVEADLNKLEVETEVGWARLHASSGQRVEQQAFRHVRRALRQQGEAHLKQSTQPQVNTARALEKLLTPVLKAAGHPDPRFRIQVGPGLILQPEG